MKSSGLKEVDCLFGVPTKCLTVITLFSEKQYALSVVLMLEARRLLFAKTVSQARGSGQ